MTEQQISDNNRLISLSIPGIWPFMERARIRVHGIVQGVFFRAHTQKEAARLKLAGSVRNMPDGSVEAIAEGPKEKLLTFIAWCQHGPSMARVDRVDVAWEQAIGEARGFRIAF